MEMLINGKWIGTVKNNFKEIINPSDGCVLDTVPQADESDVFEAIQFAQIAKEKIAKMPAHSRAQVLFDCADEMHKRKEELANLLARENGKPIRQTREEISAAIRIFRGFGEEAKRIFGKSMSLDMVPGMESHFAFTTRRPIGVVAAIVPFNYPVELYAHKAAAAIAAGNAVIAKPPSNCPLTLLKIAEILENTDLPVGAHQMITGQGSTVGEILARSEGVDLISVTGSTEVGIRISKLAADNLKRVHLELGGNDATIICEDANLEQAAEAVIMGRLARGNGQICCAVKRVLVDSKIKDKFLNSLIDKARKLVMGNPINENTDVGPLITEKAAIEVEKSILDAVASGAKLCVGGKRFGAFIEPTVLSDISDNSPIMTDEVFGPVVPVISFDSVEEAISIVNKSKYGLQASIFTNDIKTAMNAAYALDVGGVIVNWSTAVRVENLPFGGVKYSGHGRESIHDTLLEMTEQKSIILFNALSHYNISNGDAK